MTASRLKARPTTLAMLSPLSVPRTRSRSPQISHSQKGSLFWLFLLPVCVHSIEVNMFNSVSLVWLGTESAYMCMCVAVWVFLFLFFWLWKMEIQEKFMGRDYALEYCVLSKSNENWKWHDWIMIRLWGWFKTKFENKWSRFLDTGELTKRTHHAQTSPQLYMLRMDKILAQFSS